MATTRKKAAPAKKAAKKAAKKVSHAKTPAKKAPAKKVAPRKKGLVLKARAALKKSKAKRVERMIADAAKVVRRGAKRDAIAEFYAAAAKAEKKAQQIRPKKPGAIGEPRPVSHAKKARPTRKTDAPEKASRFWKHFGRDGLPAAPWETEVGPGTSGPQGDEDDDVGDDSMFADGDYDYDDFDADWGGYEYADTGYADENA